MEAQQLNIEREQTDSLVSYARNAKIHTDKQIEQIAKSISEFGFNDPVAVWTNASGESEIIEGHGRVLAAKRLGIGEIPVIHLYRLSDEQRRAYTHVHNQLTMNTGWDFETLEADFDALDFDFAEFGFNGKDMLSLGESFFNREKRNDTSRQDGNSEYNGFLDKFDAKKTTDDCYTPEKVYEAVANFVCEHYGVNRDDMVRPFYPGGDYQKQEYKDNAVVVDNPPFSILAEIIRWYRESGVQFFLFAPALTLFSSSSSSSSCAIPIGVQIEYENGAKVSTSFVTSLEDSAIHVMPELYNAVHEADAAVRNDKRKELPKYEYPVEVLTAAKCNYLAKYGQEFTVKRDECHRISKLDAQSEIGKEGIFGSGYLLSEKAAAEKAAAEKAAAEKAAAEKAAAHRFEISERERQIISKLR